MLANHPNVLGNGGTGVPSGAAGPVGGPSSSTDNALVRWSGTSGSLIKNGVVTEATDTGTFAGPSSNGTTTAVGSAFTNQPSNDIVEVVSANAGDTTQTVTIIGTTTATNTVVVETVTLNGTTAVPTVKTDWGIILAVKKSIATLGTVTVRKKTGAATITAGLTAAVLSVGVTTVAAANQNAYARTVSAVSDGATTKQIGFQGTNTSDAVIYDSKALTGATAITSNSSFRTITEIYTGDVEVARTETVTTTGTWLFTAGSFTFTPATGGQILAGIAGTTAAPVWSYLGDPDTGFYNISANTIAIVCQGTDCASFMRDSASGGLDITALGTNQNVLLQASGTGAVVLNTKASLTAKITTYNAINTAGWGVPAIYGSGRSVAQNAAVASVAAYTLTAADATFEISANVLVTTATAHSFSVTCTYTDEGNTSRTLTLGFAQLSGATLITLITNVTGAGPYESLNYHIRCKASTTITIATTGTFTTVTYNVEGSIRQLA